jgi:hypothetical protein
MRKAIIAIAIIVCASLLIKVVRSCGDHQGTNVWVGNKVSASFQDGVISENVSDCPSVSEIFIDASGSMKPYFKADDKSMVNTLSELDNLNIDGTKIYFIGKNVPYTGLISNIIGEIDKQPNESATTFHSFFKDAVCRLDTVNELIYLVTDGIMSVGPGDTSKALVQLRGKITNSLSGHANVAAAIFRYTGGYKGDYWNSYNQQLTSKNCAILGQEITRPYYVIALGRKDVIRWLHSLPVSKLNKPEALYLGIHDMKGHKSATLALGDSAVIENMNDAVNFVIELPECLKDIDSRKVKVYNKNNDLNIPVTKEGSNLMAKISPNVALIPETDGRIKITFIAKNEIPSDWVTSWSTEDDLKGPDETSTYGLKYLIEGMYNALDTSENILETNFIYKRQ